VVKKFLPSVESVPSVVKFLLSVSWLNLKPDFGLIVADPVIGENPEADIVIHAAGRGI
jgi:hypothetical protein